MVLVNVDPSGCGVGCKLYHNERNVPGQSVVPVSLSSNHHSLQITMVEKTGW